MSGRRVRYRLKGYVLVETLVAVSVAAIAAGMALQLLTWSVRQTAAARDLNDLTQTLSLIYEQARIETPMQLDSHKSGRLGTVNWTRDAEAVDVIKDHERVQPRHVFFRLTSVNPRVHLAPVEAWIWPAGAPKEN